MSRLEKIESASGTCSVVSKKKNQCCNMSSDKDILTKEIESWSGFEYALREENRILFNKMLSECKKKEYIDCVNAKGENFSAGALVLILIFEQQKMISELIAKLSDMKAYSKNRT